MSIASGPASGGYQPPKLPPPLPLGGLDVRRRTAPASSGTSASPLGRAAQYVRVSTEHQRYSTENQADAIRQYAERRGLAVVKTYADEGKSGLRLDGRDALKRLIEDVQNQKADFSTILVYNVSRWGRFQDADESAYYAYICRRAGIAVQYCAEQFENDRSPVSTIVKGVKRAMASEYSRNSLRKYSQVSVGSSRSATRDGPPADGNGPPNRRVSARRPVRRQVSPVPPRSARVICCTRLCAASTSPPSAPFPRPAGRHLASTLGS